MTGVRMASQPAPDTSRRNLRLIMGGLIEGVILLDPGGQIVWANAAALAAHGVEAIEQLGGTIAGYQHRFMLRYRNKHRLDSEAHPLTRLAAGEAFNEMTVELFHSGNEAAVGVLRLRGLVLTDDQDVPESLVLIAHDASLRYRAEERFERAFAANPAPAVICRLSDLHYIKVNHGFLEMTGYTREQVLGAGLYEIDLLAGVPERPVVLARLRDGGSIPQREVALPLPGGGDKLVIVAGQSLDIGDEPCMMFTFMDLEPRRQAERALRQSEERFAHAFRLSPVPTALLAAETLLFIDVNDAFAALTRIAAEQAVGRTPADLRLWAEPARRASTERALVDPAGCRNRDVRIAAHDGGVFDCLLSAEPVQLDGRACVLAVLQDITERKRSELELMSAIEAVMQDTSWFSRTIVEKLADLRRGEARPGPPPLGLAELTRREREVLGLLCSGLKDADIAAATGLKPNTVRNHIASLYGKIGVHRRAEAVVWGRERGITGREPPRREQTR
jgi:PAS domain S-box-containing protein